MRCVWLWLAVSVCACGRPGAVSPERAPLPPEIDAAPPDPDAPTLLDPGMEPRAERRYRVKVGTTATIDAEAASTVGHALGGSVAQPTLSLRARFEVVNVADHALSVRLTYGDTAATAESDVMTDMASQGLETIEGATVLWKLGDQGQELAYEPASATKKAARTTLQQVGRVCIAPVLRLPVEAIGRGARWRATVFLGPAYGFTHALELQLLDADGASLHIAGDTPIDEAIPGGRLAGTVHVDASVDTRTLAGTLTLSGDLTLTDEAGTATRVTEDLRAIVH